MDDAQQPPEVEHQDAGPKPAPSAAGSTAAEVYVRAVASIPELAAGDAGWLPNDERVQALIEREMLVKESPPEQP